MGLTVRCESACLERRLATSSVASFAALIARVLGIARSACAKAAMASCSREPYECVSSKPCRVDCVCTYN